MLKSRHLFLDIFQLLADKEIHINKKHPKLLGCHLLHSLYDKKMASYAYL